MRIQLFDYLKVNLNLTYRFVDCLLNGKDINEIYKERTHYFPEYCLRSKRLPYHVITDFPTILSKKGGAVKPTSSS